MKILYTFILSFTFLCGFAQNLFSDVVLAAGVGENGTNHGAFVGDFNNNGLGDIYLR